MTMFNISYGYQIAWLILFMLIMVHYDWRKNGAQSRRWKEYLYVLGAGVAGILFMLAVDAVMGTISREYYYYVRDIPEDGPFRIPVAIKSLKVGLPLGMLCGGVLAATNNPRPKRPALSWRAMLKLLFLPMLGGVVLSPFGAMLGVLFDPLHFGAKLAPLLSKQPEKLQHFLAIWGAMLGLYAGGIGGLIWTVAKIRSERRRLYEANFAATGSQAPANPAAATTGAPTKS